MLKLDKYECVEDVDTADNQTKIYELALVTLPKTGITFLLTRHAHTGQKCAWKPKLSGSYDKMLTNFNKLVERLSCSKPPAISQTDNT